jgi:hypothetical protein
MSRSRNVVAEPVTRPVTLSRLIDIVRFHKATSAAYHAALRAGTLVLVEWEELLPHRAIGMWRLRADWWALATFDRYHTQCLTIAADTVDPYESYLWYLKDLMDRPDHQIPVPRSYE